MRKYIFFTIARPSRLSLMLAISRKFVEIRRQPSDVKALVLSMDVAVGLLARRRVRSFRLDRRRGKLPSGKQFDLKAREWAGRPVKCWRLANPGAAPLPATGKGLVPEALPEAF